jgi:hypothetical protein
MPDLLGPLYYISGKLFNLTFGLPFHGWLGLTSLISYLALAATLVAAGKWWMDRYPNLRLAYFALFVLMLVASRMDGLAMASLLSVSAAVMLAASIWALLPKGRSYYKDQRLLQCTVLAWRLALCFGLVYLALYSWLFRAPRDAYDVHTALFNAQSWAFSLMYVFASIFIMLGACLMLKFLVERYGNDSHFDHEDNSDDLLMTADGTSAAEIIDGYPHGTNAFTDFPARSREIGNGRRDTTGHQHW